MTKTDLYPAWRRIVELDRRHLGDAGIDLPVIPVSSFLRLRAWRSPALNEESGFAPLFDWLRSAVLETAATHGGRRREPRPRLRPGAAAAGGGRRAAGAGEAGGVRRGRRGAAAPVRAHPQARRARQRLAAVPVRRHRPADRRRQARPGRPDADGRARRRGRHRAGRPQGHLAGHRGVAAAPGGARREREPRAARRAGRAARGGRRRDVRAGVRGAAQAGADRAGRRAARAHVRPGPARRPGQPEAGPHAVRRPGRAHPGDARGLRGERRRRPAPAGGGRTRRRDRGGLHRPQADPRRAPAAAHLPSPAGEDLLPALPRRGQLRDREGLPRLAAPHPPRAARRVPGAGGRPARLVAAGADLGRARHDPRPPGARAAGRRAGRPPRRDRPARCGARGVARQRHDGARRPADRRRPRARERGPRTGRSTRRRATSSPRPSPGSPGRCGWRSPGRVKAGKSTLLNALVGEELAPTDAGECTKLVTWYIGGHATQVIAVHKDGRREQRPFSREGGALDVDLGGRPSTRSTTSR